MNRDPRSSSYKPPKASIFPEKALVFPIQCGVKWGRKKNTLNFSEQLIWTEGKIAIVPIEIATPPRLQLSETETVCINKALDSPPPFLLSNASRSRSYICPWNSGQWSWQNVIYLHWNVPDPRFTLPAFQAGFHIWWPFWTIGGLDNFHGPQTARAWQVGSHRSSWQGHW